MNKRVFLIVLDSFGIGDMPDAHKFGDEGSNTLAAIAKSSKFNIPTLQQMGMFNIDKVTCGQKTESPTACYARLQEASNGKDTTIGHWEIAGVESANALPVYPNGFPKEVIEAFESKTGRKVICNKPYSGTEVLEDYGEEHLKTGALIVYTSADSVFQIAANESIVPVATLYEYCQIARDMLVGKHGVGRVIARPFIGDKKGNFKRTTNRHDYSLKPPAKTLLDYLKAAGKDVIGVGKIYDIFDGEGITEKIKTTGNHHGMEVTKELAQRSFEGLAFVNLVDFDMVYGHRNDVDGYANAATEFDVQLKELLPLLQPKDMLIITADHGCDPATPSTDHSRECVPLLIYGDNFKKGVNLGTRCSFANIAATVADYLQVKAEICGTSLLPEILK
ncbi:MAG: phosphopentomutase [Oscillospiraceae bacterium]|nr:phosphopentomutase [Oscillospiraceae bacterium]